MIVSVHQPNYIPWIGFFDKMDKSDVFVLLDCPDFNKRGLTHRNRIKSPNGELLLTIPLRNKYAQIRDIRVDVEQPWKKKHIGALHKNYARSAYWKTYQDEIIDIYDQAGNKLIELTIPLILFIRKTLGIDTKVVLESSLGKEFGTGSKRIAGICRHLGADIYLSGIGAQAYNDRSIYEDYGLKLQYQHFLHPEYPQFWGSFTKNLSILDLLFHCGPDSLKIIREYNPKPS